MSLIYGPAEDSYLMQGTLKKQIKSKDKSLEFLEIGCGSGILIKTLLDLKINPQNITATDINLEVIKYINNRFPKVKIIASNLFSKLNGKFDIIIFNPPYLPDDKFNKEDKESKLVTTGGKSGSEIINQFLHQSKNYLNKCGKIFLLTSSLTKEINWLNYKKKIVAKKKLFFEELFVWELG